VRMRSVALGVVVPDGHCRRVSSPGNRTMEKREDGRRGECASASRSRWRWRRAQKMGEKVNRSRPRAPWECSHFAGRAMDSLGKAGLAANWEEGAMERANLGS
jgi:hypothetical protein